MTAPPTPTRPPYPALRAFCRGYLHEDAIVEHGGAAAAARAFREDASAGERQAVAAEWRRFAVETHGWPLARVRAQFTGTLGAAWLPATRAEVEALGRALTGSR
jgi:hypothetical protein